METALSSARRPRWQHPHGAQTPRILHLPRRPFARRKSSKSVCSKTSSFTDRRGSLEPLFDDEQRSIPESEASVPLVVLNSSYEDEREEERWRVEAEMLRAECGLLRMEKEAAARKMERKRAKIERTLRSVIRTLLSGGERISEGNDVRMVLEEEINYLVEKLRKLKENPGIKDSETKGYGNFDRQALMLRKKLEKKSDGMCPREIREIAEASFSTKPSSGADEGPDSGGNMKTLRRKLEALSNGALSDRMEKEYISMISRANSSLAGSISKSKIEGSKFLEEKGCSGRCKDVVRKIVEQVRAEAKQWSQMQEMLGQVRNEMEELQTSRNYWQDRAFESESQMQSLQSTAQEWKHKALSSESRVKELQDQIVELTRELSSLETNLSSDVNTRNSEMKTQKSESKAQNSCSQHPKEPQMDTILGILICRLKENRQANNDRFKQTVKPPYNEGKGGGMHKLYPREPSVARKSPLQDIGNLSARLRQNRRAKLSSQHNYKENGSVQL